MKTHLRIAALAVTAALSSGAQAVQMFEYVYDGTLTSFWNCPGRPNGDCGFPGNITHDPWQGTLELTTPDGNGTFSGNVPGQLTLLIDGQPTFLFATGPTAPGLTVNVLNGVATMSGTALLDAIVHYSFGDGGSMTMFWSNFGPGPGIQQQVGMGTITAVPEPETWALMLASVAMIGPVLRRRASRRPS